MGDVTRAPSRLEDYEVTGAVECGAGGWGSGCHRGPGGSFGVPSQEELAAGIAGGEQAP